MPRKRRPPPESPPSPPPETLLGATPVATLDLHGRTAHEAALEARNFLMTWRRRQPGAVVRIITGKGTGSGGPAVLRPRVQRLLEGELTAFVRGWSLDLHQGGFLVRLR